MSDADALLMGGRPAEDTHEVCTRGDLAAEYATLDGRLRDRIAAQAIDPRAAGDPEAQQIIDRMDALRAEMQAATVTFRLRALARKRWADLREQHQPRQESDGSVHADDAQAGVNNETFFPALIRASVVEPTLQDDTWDALLDPDGELLNDAQFQALANKCWNLNERDVRVPFSPAALLMMRRSASG